MVNSFEPDGATIVRGIDCYGDILDNSNYLIIADSVEGYEIEEIILGNAEKSWSAVIDRAYALLGRDASIYEISAV